VPAPRANERPTDTGYRLALQAKRDLILASQRAWLGERGKACPAAAMACLSKAYQDRIKALRGL
jgi:hypothetical protein